MVLVLLGVHSKTLSDKFDINTIYVLNESGDRRQDLLGDVPVNIKFMQASRAQHLIRVICLVCKLRVLFVGLERLLANHVRDEVVDQLCLRLTLSFLSDSDSHMRKTLNV